MLSHDDRKIANKSAGGVGVSRGSGLYYLRPVPGRCTTDQVMPLYSCLHTYARLLCAPLSSPITSSGAGRLLVFGRGRASLLAWNWPDELARHQAIYEELLASPEWASQAAPPAPASRWRPLRGASSPATWRAGGCHCRGRSPPPSLKTLSATTVFSSAPTRALRSSARVGTEIPIRVIE